MFKTKGSDYYIELFKIDLITQYLFDLIIEPDDLNSKTNL